jgi:hypothetical protein
MTWKKLISQIHKLENLRIENDKIRLDKKK